MPTLCEAISLKRPESCMVCDFSRSFLQSEGSVCDCVSSAGCAGSPQGLTTAKEIFLKKCPNGTAESQYELNSQKVANQEERGRSLSSTFSMWKHFCLQTFTRYGGKEKKKGETLGKTLCSGEIQRRAAAVVSAHHNWTSCQGRRANEDGGGSLSSLLLRSAEKRSMWQINGILAGKILKLSPLPQKIIYLDSRVASLVRDEVAPHSPPPPPPHIPQRHRSLM